MNGFIGYILAFFGWNWDDVLDKRRIYSFYGGRIKIDGFCF